MKPIRPFLAVLATSAVAAAQCAFSSITVTTAGPGCNPVVGNATPPLSALFDVPTCQLGFRGSILLGSPLQLPISRVLVLGASAAPQALPALGPGCVLVPSPDVYVLQGIYAGYYQIRLPAAPLPPATVYAQGAVIYFLAGGGGTQVVTSTSVSEALQVTLR